jgi:hypothetical protein
MSRFCQFKNFYGSQFPDSVIAQILEDKPIPEGQANNLIQNISVPIFTINCYGFPIAVKAIIDFNQDETIINYLTAQCLKQNREFTYIGGNNEAFKGYYSFPLFLPSTPQDKIEISCKVIFNIENERIPDQIFYGRTIHLGREALLNILKLVLLPNGGICFLPKDSTLFCRKNSTILPDNHTCFLPNIPCSVDYRHALRIPNVDSLFNGDLLKISYNRNDKNWFKVEDFSILGICSKICSEFGNGFYVNQNISFRLSIDNIPYSFNGVVKYINKDKNTIGIQMNSESVSYNHYKIIVQKKCIQIIESYFEDQMKYMLPNCDLCPNP